MRSRLSFLLAFRGARRAGVAFLALTSALSPIVQANQAPSLASGVYSAAQASRGRQLYRGRCAECHGAAMEGGSGPPLAGSVFLSTWSARPLAALVDKIQKTMPFNAAGTLSRTQSIDLAAAVLEAAKYPSGARDLTEAALSQIAFATTAAAPAASSTRAAATSVPPPEGNLAELMRAIAFPNSNIIFNVQLRDPGTQTKKDLATAPFDYVVWGSSVYPGWLAVDQAAVALTETAYLLLTPGRRCQNGRPVPVDRADWKQYVTALEEAGRLARRAAQSRNFEAFADVSDTLNTACANCHQVYRDKGGAEGSGVNRCQ